MTKTYKGYHPTLWKSGYQNYYFHTPIEYKILATRESYSDTPDIYWRVGDNEIIIRSLTIGEFKKEILYIEGKQIKLSDYYFWIPRKRIRRGPGSFKQKTDRWVHKETFDKCLKRAVNGDPYFKEGYFDE